MTIKEAFEKLVDTTAAAMKNPFFVMRKLHSAFVDIADNIEGGGSSITTTPVKVGTITIGANTFDVYERLITGLSLTLGGTDWAVSTAVTDIANLLDLKAYYTTANYGYLSCAIAEAQASPAGGFQIYGFAGYERTVDTVIIRYIQKTT